MITTIYICDRCKHKQKGHHTPRQMWEIALVYDTPTLSYTHSPLAVRQKQMWCRTCMEEFLILPSTQKPKPPPPPEPPTLEDIIRELIIHTVEEIQS